jgi:hypothetical protein
MKKYSLLALLVFPLFAYTQNQQEAYFKLTRAGFNEKNAYETTAFVEQFFRVPGNSGFNASIHYVEEILKKAGFKQQVADERENTLTYRIEKRPMKRNTWEPVSASIQIVGETTALQSYTTNRNMIPINCISTPEGGVSAEVVFVNKASEQDLAGKDLKGQIVFGDIAASRLLELASKAGAVGVLGYSLPSYNQASKHPNSISFSGISTQSNIWALLLSNASKERLKTACNQGKVVLNVNIQTKIYPSEELTLVANVRGAKKPQERFVFSAHVQEPGANDNASGVGTLAEMARLTANLVQNGSLKPDRTLTFLWGDEIVSTRRYITDDSIRAKGILWGMSLDMVGEDTEKTGGTFLIEKMPDPSAIWTRGNDKHTEWGAGDVQEKDLFPHYYNDFVYDICKAQGKYANWTVSYNPFEGGSDHTPFLQHKIPGLLMWHFTDVFYHTDNDRIDKVSTKTLKNVGVCALTTAYTLVTATPETALTTLSHTKQAALARLATEFALSKTAIESGKPIATEQQIIEAWAKWYVAAFESVKQMPLYPRFKLLDDQIMESSKEIINVKNSYINQLKSK